jgi:hypothetical protein
VRAFLNTEVIEDADGAAYSILAAPGERSP